jgi:hypothetical protein
MIITVFVFGRREIEKYGVDVIFNIISKQLVVVPHFIHEPTSHPLRVVSYLLPRSPWSRIKGAAGEGQLLAEDQAYSGHF